MHNKKVFKPTFLVLIIIGVLLLGTAGFLVINKLKTPQQLIVGGDEDIHGCVGSAGYSWCEIKQKCLRVWEEKCKATSTYPINNKEIIHGDTNNKEVIFTFDGGATIQSADKVLEVLTKHHVKGTFFITGKMIEMYPDLIKRIVAQGHEIFSHTYDHPDLTTLSNEKITNELLKTESVLLATINLSPKPYFRAPYGARDARVLAVAAKAGYQSVYWTVDALDWEEPQGKTAIQVKERILSNVTPGTIYLMHLGDTITGAVLDDVFTSIEARGYHIVSLTQGI